MASSPMRPASCPSQWLSLVCKIPILLFGLKETNTIGYVESRNGNYRQDHKRLTRRRACHSKKVSLHDAQIDLLTGIYNFVDENRSFRQCIHPNAKRFAVKYKKYSPAMLEGFTDCCLTLEELLMWRVPK